MLPTGSSRPDSIEQWLSSGSVAESFGAIGAAPLQPQPSCSIKLTHGAHVFQACGSREARSKSPLASAIQFWTACGLSFREG